MSKTITISDKAYNIIKQSAENSGRSLIRQLDILLEQLASASGSSSVPKQYPLKDPAGAGDERDDEEMPFGPTMPNPFAKDGEWPTDKNHATTIPSVDTSQPRESITPHKRWVPTTPEELEAELEKVHRGEREP